MQINEQHRPLVGIVGGMGPLASTAFLSTIYELTCDEIEQHSGRLILYSDPTIPDRTEAFLNQRESSVYEPFVRILRSLERLHVKKIVVCCVTLHYLFPALPLELRELLISLVDTTFTTLQRRTGKYLLFCTAATLQLGIFQHHPQWKNYKDMILIPDESDQCKIHTLIYQLKAHQHVEEVAAALEPILAKYNVDAFIAGCTEAHLLSRYMRSLQVERRYHYLDPLMIIAQEIAEELV